MEDILKRLLEAEKKAEEQVEQADAARRQMIQDALDTARQAEIEFEKQAEARRSPFLAKAEEEARRRVAQMEEASSAQQRRLRERAARNEEAAVEAALALILGRN